MSEKISVILTVWKRDHLEEQIVALSNQTIRPDEIWVYHCKNFSEFDHSLLNKYSFLKYQRNTHDLGYFGRFSLALNFNNPYVMIIDDDIIPSKNWLEICLEKCKRFNCIISPSGRIIPKNDYMPEDYRKAYKVLNNFIGMPDANKVNTNDKDIYVDFGCNSWFIKTEWLHLFWSIKPFTLSTGEDMHLSGSSLLSGKIKTLCPKQDAQIGSGNLKVQYGFDDYASWKENNFLSLRRKVLIYLINKCGWRPLNW